jgi:hypothetical protein
MYVPNTRSGTQTFCNWYFCWPLVRLGMVKLNPMHPWFKPCTAVFSVPGLKHGSTENLRPVAVERLLRRDRRLQGRSKTCNACGRGASAFSCFKYDYPPVLSFEFWQTDGRMVVALDPEYLAEVQLAVMESGIGAALVSVDSEQTQSVSVSATQLLTAHPMPTAHAAPVDAAAVAVAVASSAQPMPIAFADVDLEVGEAAAETADLPVGRPVDSNEHENEDEEESGSGSSVPVPVAGYPALAVATRAGSGSNGGGDSTHR